MKHQVRKFFFYFSIFLSLLKACIHSWLSRYKVHGDCLCSYANNHGHDAYELHSMTVKSDNGRPSSLLAIADCEGHFIKHGRPIIFARELEIERHSFVHCVMLQMSLCALTAASSPISTAVSTPQPATAAPMP